MTSGPPWSVKGIDPKAREAAKDLARRSGMTLGEWLNQVILEDGAADEPAPAPPPMEFRPAERRPASPIYRRAEAPDHFGDEIYRVTEALDRLAGRIEAAESRTAQVVGGVDQSVSSLVKRLDGAERENTITAARFEGVVAELRDDQARIAERLRRAEQEAAAPGPAEALRTMEGAIAKVAGHLYEGETRTREALEALREEFDGVSARVEAAPQNTAALVDNVVARIAERLEQAEARTTSALRGLETSFGQLDGRLQAAESRIENKASSGGLEQIAAALANGVASARTEMAEKLKSSSDGRFDRMEQALQEMTSHVQGAERRSADALERMGHEVLRMAETLGRKVQDVERRSADAIEQVGGDVARIADAVETRFNRADATGAQALERLGGEIARITERLAERIANAERRSAQAFDDVGEQVSRVSEKMQDRQERASSDLAERIRQSEERTARLLEGARERIDHRLEETHRRAPDPAPLAAAAPAALTDPDVAPFGQSTFSQPAFGEERFNRAADPDFAPIPERAEESFAPSAFEDDSFTKPAFSKEGFAPDRFAPDRFVEPSAFDDAAPAGGAPDFAADPFLDPAPGPGMAGGLTRSIHAEPLAEEPLPFGQSRDPGAVPERRSLSTKELIDQARAAARVAAQSTDPKVRKAAARSNAEHSGGGFSFAGLTLGGGSKKKPKRRQASALGAALMVSGGAAALSLGAAGYIVLSGQPGGALPARVAAALSGHAAAPAPATPLATEVAPQPAAGGPALAAVALSPQTPAAADAAQAPGAPAETPTQSAADFYSDGVRKIEARDNSGVESLRKSANLGYAPAQFYLAKLYEGGEAGLKKDLGEARVWTQRAADAGDRKAMHNLALYFVEGAGGPKNTTTAAQWFRRAADLGLVDSQYNLGRLYEEGFGVSQNPAEAYKWYLIAARSGDGESRASAQRLKGQISAEAQAAAERAAASFQSQPTRPVNQLAQATLGSEVGSAAGAQKALTRLGYYQGPTDGTSSPALKLAIQAYQRDQGLPPTGMLDTALSARFAQIAP
jgi:localization factor PodJL